MTEDRWTSTERDAGLYEARRADRFPDRPDPSEYAEDPEDRTSPARSGVPSPLRREDYLRGAVPEDPPPF